METETPLSLPAGGAFAGAFSAVSAPATPGPSPRTPLASFTPPAELVMRARCAAKTAAAAWVLQPLRNTLRLARRSSIMLHLRVCTSPSEEPCSSVRSATEYRSEPVHVTIFGPVAQPRAPWRPGGECTRR